MARPCAGGPVHGSLQTSFRADRRRLPVAQPLELFRGITWGPCGIVERLHGDNEWSVNGIRED